MSDPKSRTEGRSKLRIDGQEDHDTDEPRPHLRGRKVNGQGHQAA